MDGRVEHGHDGNINHFGTCIRSSVGSATALVKPGKV